MRFQISLISLPSGAQVLQYPCVRDDGPNSEERLISEKLEKAVTVNFKNTPHGRWDKVPGSVDRPKVRGKFTFPRALREPNQQRRFVMKCFNKMFLNVLLETLL